MAERTHLSIGEVLSLLREEFPDVTISKIRFLESQGLVDPERTPSGYRKFYEHDVERLRWILRQQREHFLPLKVIRGRLNEQGSGGPADGPLTPEEASAVPLEPHADLVAVPNEPETVSGSDRHPARAAARVSAAPEPAARTGAAAEPAPARPGGPGRPGAATPS